jgi:hypothetical protein
MLPRNIFALTLFKGSVLWSVWAGEFPEILHTNNSAFFTDVRNLLQPVAVHNSGSNNKATGSAIQFVSFLSSGEFGKGNAGYSGPKTQFP